jgi:hypothetical protein
VALDTEHNDTVCLLLRDCEVQALGVVAAVRLSSFKRDSPGGGNPRQLAGAGHVGRGMKASPVAPQMAASHIVPESGEWALWEFPTIPFTQREDHCIVALCFIPFAYCC